MWYSVPRRVLTAFTCLILVPALVYLGASLSVSLREAREQQIRTFRDRQLAIGEVRQNFYRHLEVVKFAAAYRAAAVQPIKTAEWPGLASGLRMVLHVKRGRLVRPWVPQSAEHTRWAADLQRKLDRIATGSQRTLQRSPEWERWLIEVQHGFRRGMWPPVRTLDQAVRVAKAARQEFVLRVLVFIEDQMRDVPTIEAEFAERFWPVVETRGARQPWLTVSERTWIASFAPESEESGLFICVELSDAVKSFNTESKSAWLSFTPGNKGEWMGQDFPDLRLSIVLADEASSPRYAARAGLMVTGVAVVLGAAAFSVWLLYGYAKRVLHLARLRSEFISSVTHELRTPLTSIRMFAEMIQLASAGACDRIEGYALTVVHESERLTRLVDNVVTFSRMEGGSYVCHRRRIVMQDVVDTALNAMSHQLSVNGFTVEVDCDEQLAPVDGDADALQQAVMNLVSNAMKYSGNSKCIRVTLHRTGEYVSVVVVDRGIGIADESQSLVFERFFRVSDADTAHIQGAGIGLAIVKQIVEAHNGRISVESQVGQGSTFCISLPVVPT